MFLVCAGWRDRRGDDQNSSAPDQGAPVHQTIDRNVEHDACRRVRGVSKIESNGHRRKVLDPLRASPARQI